MRGAFFFLLSLRRKRSEVRDLLFFSPISS
jgi:hypothetical protein